MTTPTQDSVVCTREAPGPRGHFLLGSLLERRRDPIGLYMSGALEYGDVVKYKMGPRFVYLVSNPDGIKHVLQDNHKNYIKGFGYDKLEPVLGNGLLTSEGDFWRRQRKLAQPAFHRQKLSAISSTITDCIRGMLERWNGQFLEREEPLDISREMGRLTLQVASLTLLGMDVSGEADEIGISLKRLLHEANRRILSLNPIIEKLPTPAQRQFVRDRDLLNSAVFRIIEHRRRSNERPNDLLSMLMDARDEETGEGMSNEQLRAEIMTFFLAGHETTANAMTWVFFVLSHHPSVWKKLCDEVDVVLQGRQPSFEDLPKLRYTLMVIEETMRLYPPAWVFSREALGADEVCGYHIPARGIIAISPYVMHRHPAYWENPEGFDPERFADPAVVQKKRNIYIPFGGGPRQCIGSNFALMEAQLILSMVAQRYRLDLLPGQRVELEPYITLRPKGEVFMRIYAIARASREFDPVSVESAE